MSCKDCIHYQMCHSIDINAPCAAFKNKADFVEVVRCERCKYCKAIINRDGNGCVYCDRTFAKFDVDPTDFCSYGERKFATDTNVGSK